jgi:hypothetical protein
MKDFNFRESTRKKEPKQQRVTNKHIEATRRNNPPKTKRTKPKPQQQYQEPEVRYLSTELSKNYEGKVEGIMAYIKTLPKDIQKLIHLNPIKTVLARQGHSRYVMKGNLTLKITDVKQGKKNRLLIEFKEGKKRTLTTYI